MDYVSGSLSRLLCYVIGLDTVLFVKWGVCHFRGFITAVTLISGWTEATCTAVIRI